jgi:hypothetical protein
MLLPFIENGEVEIKTIFETGLRVRGEDNFRFLSLEGVVESVKDGVREGIFGVARGKGEKPICGEEGLEEVDGSWWVVEREKCQEGEAGGERTGEEERERGEVDEGEFKEASSDFSNFSGFSDFPQLELETPFFEGERGGRERGEEVPIIGGGFGFPEEEWKEGEWVESLHLSTQVPRWRGEELLLVLNLLTDYFQKVEVEIRASNGRIPKEKAKEIEEQLNLLRHLS